ncbi:hypothetical protein GCM10023147_36880 [Tsukamurella soli]|uniref:Uncharacterized protein n=1 Tax=Tsukamurella soli TaxID=644556 RepID=A0ABP8K2V6_9ACTN
MERIRGSRVRGVGPFDGVQSRRVVRAHSRLPLLRGCDRLVRSAEVVLARHGGELAGTTLLDEMDEWERLSRSTDFS